ncbi:MAG TPA: PorP/SprF family type IX secretion system membrane protein [Edaphocola sp.]|nr:PorP/SprF family type IX secretion system membrane protein [Edaphocola sp.]
MIRVVILTFLIILLSLFSKGQGIHFSQYYNAPQLVNPANTGLMPQEDFSAGVNYREQWTSVPAPFKTLSAHGDFQLMRNRNVSNWMGVGLAFYSDKAGDGILALNKIQASLAYHVQMGDYNMLSAGITTAYIHRSIDFDRLTFDAQWDGFEFDRSKPQNEPYSRQSLSYLDFTLGINYAFFPNENFYIKAGFGLMHLNRPNESFYKSDNRLGIRPIANMEMIIKTGDNLIINPSLYYSNQKKASELVFGSLFNVALGNEMDFNNVFFAGLFYRLGDGYIPVIGTEWNRFRVMFSYDVTISPLTAANRSKGAFELGIVFKSLYGEVSKGRDSYNCPRF